MAFLTDWVTSDSHFLHKNIEMFCQRPKDHQEIMVSRWNSVVGPEDTILHLGDLVLGKRVDAEKFFANNPLNGKKYLLRGNHDKRSVAFYASLGFTVIKPFDVEFEGWRVFFTHYPLTPPVKTLEQKEISIHGHVHNLYVPNLTVQHYNVGVDMRHLTPVSTEWAIRNTIRRVTEEDRSRDYQPGGKDFDPPED